MIRGSYEMFPLMGWCIKIIGKAAPGDTVEVPRPNGTVHRHKIANRVVNAKGISLWTIVPVTRDRIEEVYGTISLPHAAVQGSARLR